MQLQHRAAVPHLVMALSLVLALTLAPAQKFANLSRPKLRNAEYDKSAFCDTRDIHDITT